MPGPKVQKLGPHSRKSVNPEGVGDSAARDTAVESLEVDFRIVLQRAICCRKPVRQLQSIAGCDAARLDLGKGPSLGLCQSHSLQSSRDDAGAFWHSTTKGKKARLSESGPSGLRVCLLVASRCPRSRSLLAQP